MAEHGIDVGDWRDGGWKDWDRDKWLGGARDFVNRVIEKLWDAERMRGAEDPGKTVSSRDASADRGVGDPVRARSSPM